MTHNTAENAHKALRTPLKQCNQINTLNASAWFEFDLPALMAAFKRFPGREYDDEMFRRYLTQFADATRNEARRLPFSVVCFHVEYAAGKWLAALIEEVKRDDQLTYRVTLTREEFTTQAVFDRIWTMLEIPAYPKGYADAAIHKLAEFSVMMRSLTRWMNLPIHFVVECASSLAQKVQAASPAKAKKLLNDHRARPRYVLMTPDAIKRISVCDSTTASHKWKRGSMVRGHFRTYSAECFKHMRGKCVWIEPHWAGPTEFKHPDLGVRYRVLATR